jgi:DNA-binding MarR family transcriptional regulator
MNAREAFSANLIGAGALLAGEVVLQATERATGHGGQAAAALVVIGDQPGLSGEELRSALRLSQPGATHLVGRLVAAGWVDRGQGPDARRHALTLTAAGRAAVEELLQARRAAVAALIQPLDAAEREQLAAIAAKLLASRTAGRADLMRLCRLCERPVCDRCPVSAALSGQASAR